MGSPNGFTNLNTPARPWPNKLLDPKRISKKRLNLGGVQWLAEEEALHFMATPAFQVAFSTTA